MSDNYQKLLQQLSKRLGGSAEQIQSAAQQGDMRALLRNTDADTAGKVQDILSDPEKTKQLMNSPQAKALLKLLGES